MSAMAIKSDVEVSLTTCGFVNPGYSFKGWAESATGEVKYTDGATYVMGLESQYYLFAIWEIAVYEITYRYMGGTVSVENPTSYTINDTVVTIVNPTREGYNFAGWIGTGIYFDNPSMDISFVPGTDSGNYGNRAFTATWDPLPYTITYYKNDPDKDDDTDDKKSDTAYTGTSYQLLVNTFVYEGYKFVGWATERGSSSIVYSANETITYPPQDMKLYAVWSSSYAVELNQAGTGYYIKAVINQEQYMTIPAFYWDGKPIIGIAKDAFNGKSTILSLTIAHDETGERTSFTIGENAFINCYNMTHIVIPEEITDIGLGAFNSCRGLQSISFAATNGNVSSDGRYEFIGNCIIDNNYQVGVDTTRAVVVGFNNSTMATDLNITVIGKKAFKGMTGLRNITLPTVTTLTIEEEAFFGCTGLEAISIPANVASINAYAFSGCSGATSLYFATSGTGELTIESYAFKGCTKIVSVEIPEQCSNIQPYAFSGCKGIEALSVNNNNRFQYYSRDDSLGSEGVNFNAIIKKDGTLNVVVVGCGQTQIRTQMDIIGEGAFHNMGYINYNMNTLPKGIKEIGNYAFYGCTFATGMLNTKNLTNIGEGAFAGCANLTTVTITDTVTTIGSNAFNNCNAITSITCPCTEANKPAGWVTDWYGNVSADKIVWAQA